jgi:hypothetical protein
MKKATIFYFIAIALAATSLSGCYKLQKDYEYKKFTLDPNINMTAKEYLLKRGTAGVGSDTIFKWMQMGIEYAGLDLAEYEKPGRTYIFLHNNAVRTITGSGASAKITGGFFFDYPIIGRDASGNVIKSKIDPTQDSMRIPTAWEEYPQSFVKSYFLYLIIQGEYTFENLKLGNTTVQTLLPPGTSDVGKVTKLSRVVTQTQPNPDPTLYASITYSATTDNTGFDPEGKLNLGLSIDQSNRENAFLYVNDRTPNRRAGYFATNGKLHVYDKTVHPFRYSWQ